MQVRLSRKVMVLLLLVVLALFAVAATVSAAEMSGAEMSVAAADVSGAEGIITTPISGLDLRWISPWGIDATRDPSLILPLA